MTSLTMPDASPDTPDQQETSAASPQSVRARIATVIVNYNAAALVIDHLPALLEAYAEIGATSGADGIIYIVDNNSPNGDADLLRTHIETHALEDRIVLMAEPENWGFSKGNNVALRAIFSAEAAPPDYVFLLNPDAYPRPGMFPALLGVMEKTPDAGIAGARLEGEDGAAQNSAFNFFSASGQLAASAGINSFWKLFPGKQIAPPQRDETYVADWVCGAAALIRREVFDAVGFFDEAYFLYYEETDLMLAAKRKGWRTWYVHDAKAVHLVGQSSDMKDGRRSDDVSPLYWFDSRMHYFKKNFGPVYAFLAEAGWVLGSAFFVVSRRLFGKPDRNVGADIKQFFKARRERQQSTPMTSHAQMFPQNTAPLEQSIQDGAPPPMPKGDSNENPTGLSFWSLVAEDYRTHGGDFFSQGFWALFGHRFGNWRMSVKSKLLRAPLTLLYRIHYKLTQLLCGIDIPYTTKVGRRVTLEHFGGMILVARCIGDDVIIRQNTTFGVRNTHELNAKPIIGNHVDIGVGAVLIGHVTIGDHASIGANAVVAKDVPPYGVAVGVPAKVVKIRAPQGDL